MKTPVHALVLAAILASTAGCQQLVGAMAALPTPAPSGVPVVGASAAPGTTTPTATAAPSANATPAPAATAKPTAAPAGDVTAADCKSEKSDADKDNGTAKLGGYDNQWLPKGWVAAYNSEQEVTEAIDKIKDADWACFQKFYPGASTIWKKRRGLAS